MSKAYIIKDAWLPKQSHRDCCVFKIYLAFCDQIGASPFMLIMN